MVMAFGDKTYKEGVAIIEIKQTEHYAEFGGT